MCTLTKCICLALCWSHVWTAGSSRGARGWHCVGDLQSSVGLSTPHPRLVSVLTSSMGNFSPNNLPPQSPGTKSAFHQHHCLSLLHRLVLLHHGNNPSSPPVHVPSVSGPAMCQFWVVPAAAPLYVEKYMMQSFCGGFNYLLLTSGSLGTIIWALVATGHPYWPVIDELINGLCVCAHICFVGIQPQQAIDLSHAVLLVFVFASDWLVSHNCLYFSFLAWCSELNCIYSSFCTNCLDLRK